MNDEPGPAPSMDENDKMVRSAIATAVRGYGGVHDALVALREFATEQADQCEAVTGDPGKAELWRKLAKKIEGAELIAAALTEIL